MDTAARQSKERSIWDRLAPRYDRNVMAVWKNAYELSIRKALAAISPGQQVLEIGCGTGIISFGVAPHVQRLIAVDLSPQMIAEARAKAQSLAVSNIDFHIGDGYSLPFADGCFDVVLLFNVLHIVQQPAALLREAHRLLKPGGLVVSATDCDAEAAPLSIRLKLIAQWLLKLVGVIPIISYYRRQDVNRLFERNGFAIVETADLHPAPVNYYVLARKA